MLESGKALETVIRAKKKDILNLKVVAGRQGKCFPARLDLPRPLGSGNPVSRMEAIVESNQGAQPCE